PTASVLHILFLTDSGAESEDLGVTIILEPAKNDRCIDAARSNARTILLGDDFARSSEQDYAEFGRSLCCVASLRVRKMRARHPFRAPLARRDLIIIW